MIQQIFTVDGMGHGVEGQKDSEEVQGDRRQ